MIKLKDIKMVIEALEISILDDIDYTSELAGYGLYIDRDINKLKSARQALVWVSTPTEKKRKEVVDNKKLKDYNIENPLP